MTRLPIPKLSDEAVPLKVVALGETFVVADVVDDGVDAGVDNGAVPFRTPLPLKLVGSPVLLVTQSET